MWNFSHRYSVGLNFSPLYIWITTVSQGHIPMTTFFVLFFFVQHFTSNDSALHCWSSLYVLGNIGHLIRCKGFSYIPNVVYPFTTTRIQTSNSPTSKSSASTLVLSALSLSWVTNVRAQETNNMKYIWPAQTQHLCTQCKLNSTALHWVHKALCWVHKASRWLSGYQHVGIANAKVSH